MERIQLLDTFGKPKDDYRTKTALGGIITISAIALIAALLVFEWHEFQRISWRPELIVDMQREEQMSINFDVSFPKVPCLALNLDVMDVAEDFQNNLHDNVSKMRLAPNGDFLGKYQEPDLGRPANYCGRCLLEADGSKKNDSQVVPECCNSCSAVLGAYEHNGMVPPSQDAIEQCRQERWPERLQEQRGEGCRISGSIRVNKVSGNFHFAAGPSYDLGRLHMHDLRFLKDLHLDFNHRIYELGFGQQHAEIINPLDGAASNLLSKPIEKAGDPADGERTFKYFLKIVGTEFNYRRGHQLHTNQYAVTSSQNESARRTPGERSSVAFPSVFFFYDISPMIVVYTEYKKPLISFLTGLCAVIGGVYTLAAIIDSIVFAAERRIREKQALGKTY